jgi:hypothetical protein
VKSPQESHEVFSPERFIDRVAEQELFTRLLTFEDEARILTICDRGGRGKSQLLQALRYHCQYAAEEVPAALVPINELTEKTAHGLVRALEDRLRPARVEFPRLDLLEQAERAARAEGPTNVKGAMSGPGMTVAPGGVAGGTVFMGPVTIVEASPLAADVPEAVRDKAIDAFLDDLAAACRVRPTVLLFDAFEQCSAELEEWLPRFLRRTVVDPETRIDRLVVVIAGRQVPTAGLRMMLGKRFDLIVKSIKALSLWEHEHVKAFLDLNDVKDYNDSDVNWIVDSLKRGRPLSLAVSAVSQFQREGVHGS